MKKVIIVSIPEDYKMGKKGLQNVEGGAWIADAVEWLICDCHWHYPAGSYHNAMMMKGI